jgi:glutaredoxin-like protein NrdH
MPSAGENLDVVLYSKPGCVQCTATKRGLEQHKVRYRVIDVTESEQAEARVRELGYQQLPVMDIPFDREVFDTDGNRLQHWYGYRPDLLEQLAPPAPVETATAV